MNTPNARTDYEYEDSPPAALWRGPIRALEWHEVTHDGVVPWHRKRGPCPRCRHDHGINLSVEAEGYAGLGPEDDTDIFVVCECKGDEERPANVLTGCGWRGYVDGPVTSRG